MRSKDGDLLVLVCVNVSAMNLYMLMSPGNAVQPAAFVPNFVTGILFMNKADHTTYFGGNLEYIHGIHMIPLTPISPFIRLQSFVAAEWTAKLSAKLKRLASFGDRHLAYGTSKTQNRGAHLAAVAARCSQTVCAAA